MERIVVHNEQTGTKKKPLVFAITVFCFRWKTIECWMASHSTIDSVRSKKKYKKYRAHWIVLVLRWPLEPNALGKRIEWKNFDHFTFLL
jgi:hypothetical protein